jgi:hypothetical protein
VSAIVRRLMDKDPDQRFQTPGELARALAPWCNPMAAATPVEEASAQEDAKEKTPVAGNSDGFPVADESLAEAWCRWVDVVEGFARRRGNRLGVSETEYTALHQLAVDACRTCEDSAAGEARRRFADLRERVQPWLSLEALARADREILADLLAHCQHLEPLLTGGRRRRSSRRVTAAVCLGAAALLAMAWWMTNGFGLLKPRPGDSWLGSVFENVRQMIVTVGKEIQTHPILWGSALCALVLLLSIYLVARLPRV